MIGRMTKARGTGLKTQYPCGFCLHYENGRIVIPKTCIRHYECWRCAFDQWIEEMEEREQIEGSFKISRQILANAA